MSQKSTFVNTRNKLLMELSQKLITYSVRHKACLNKYKKTKITPSILSDYKRLKLDISNSRRITLLINSWNLNTSLVSEKWVKIKINERLSRNNHIKKQMFSQEISLLLFLSALLIPKNMYRIQRDNMSK